MDRRIVAIAGGTGFIGGAIARRLAAIAGLRVRVLSRRPENARQRFAPLELEFARADVTDPATLAEALAGAQVVINAAQFEGYPVENPRRGLTFERVDYRGTVALLAAARSAPAEHFVYISGAAADERSAHPGFAAKGRAERAIRASAIPYTILRPSLVFGPGDRVVNMLARAIRFAPVFAVPGTGGQKVQPVLVDDLTACVALALTAGAKALNQTFEVGGPELMTFDQMIGLIMEVTGYRRPIVHIPAWLMRIAGSVAERLPRPVFSRDAVTFVTADNACDIGPLVERLGIRLTPMRQALSYLAPRG